MREALLIFASAALGATVQEILCWYDIYKRLDAEKHQSLINSRKYWGIVCAFIVVTGLISLIWFNNQNNDQHPNLRDVLVFGISLPLIVKQIIRSRPEQIRLGSRDGAYFDGR